MEGSQVAEPVPEQKVLAAIDLAVVKLRAWALECLKEAGGTEEEEKSMREAMNRDALVYVPFIRDFLKDHSAALFGPNQEALDYFQSKLAPEHARFKITEKFLDKGRLFARVFASLFRDLQQSQE